MLNVGLIAAGGWALSGFLQEKAGQRDSVAEIAKPTPTPAITTHTQPPEHRQADDAGLRLQRARANYTRAAAKTLGYNCVGDVAYTQKLVNGVTVIENDPTIRCR